MEIIPLPLFSNFKPLAHHNIIFHCMIIEFVIQVKIKFLTVFPNNMKVPVYWRFFEPTRHILFQSRFEK